MAIGVTVLVMGVPGLLVLDVIVKNVMCVVIMFFYGHMHLIWRVVIK